MVMKIITKFCQNALKLDLQYDSIGVYIPKALYSVPYRPVFTVALYTTPKI